MPEVRSLADERKRVTKLVPKLAAADRDPSLLSQFDRLLDGNSYATSLTRFDTFLPPRLVHSLREGHCIPFFGAGVSASAGIPTWWDLLSLLGFPADLKDDPDLASDPLTAAEVLAHQIGLPALQQALIDGVRPIREPTLAHALLCALQQRVYVTTNYDDLFEATWLAMFGEQPRVITTDADLREVDVAALLAPADAPPVIFKLHGSVDRKDEELILTRSQYRRHYRSNTKLFDAIRALLGTSNTLFLGFGHRDPEITRLVEDVIHSYESQTETDSHPDTASRPAFYSLQFDMRERTPEIFAARGIVALRPPVEITVTSETDPRTRSLARSLIDMLGAKASDQHRRLDIDAALTQALKRIGKEIDQHLTRLDDLAKACLAAPSGTVTDKALGACGKALGEMAGQGLYVLDARGRVHQHWLPPGLNSANRKHPSFEGRPYVQQARMYRVPFASSIHKSTFNQHGTIFLCAPIVEDAEYRGLVFSAFQPGSWSLPLKLAAQAGKRRPNTDVSFLLIDANGIVLMPPNGEFVPIDRPLKGEPEGMNRGYPFDRLARLSRRDKLVERIWNNIVPLAQDDDAFRLNDIQLYSVVAEVPRTRWKCAVSIPYPTEA
jgi:hypothetical protein